jgi:hypothetical protein
MEWIKCSDRRPDKTGVYLFYVPSGDRGMPFINTSWYSVELGGMWDSVVKVWADSINDIGYWMPLPEGPAEAGAKRV